MISKKNNKDKENKTEKNQLCAKPDLLIELKEKIIRTNEKTMTDNLKVNR